MKIIKSKEIYILNIEKSIYIDLCLNFKEVYINVV